MKGKNKSVRAFERLETRELMAGNVTAAVTSGSLYVTGDNAANMLQMTEVSGNRWKITGLGGTKINGKSQVTTAQPVTNDVQIDLNGGNDNVTIQNGSVPHILNVFGDDGNNVTTLHSVKVGYGLGVYGNDGNNTVVANKVNVQAIGGIYYSVFAFGNGNNVVAINNLRARDFRVYTGSGMDSVTVTNSTLQSGSSLTLDTGDGRDAVSLSKVKTDTLSVDVGGGNMDSVTSVKSTAGTATFADTDGTNGIIAGMDNHFGSQTIDPNFKYRSGDLQQDTI
jgi:hypothetical protein